MIYKIVTTDKFKKSFKKLDKQVQKFVKSWIDKNLMNCTDPRTHGKGLTGNSSGQWRYRIGNYRLLADIQDEKVILVLVQIGHR